MDSVQFFGMTGWNCTKANCTSMFQTSQTEKINSGPSIGRESMDARFAAYVQ
jgi:hypothetical protein